jgi:hypothetical protein
MADIELVVKISEDSYKATCNGWMLPSDVENVVQGIKNGTPLPKGHGAIKDISQIEIPMCEDRAYETWVQVAINSAPTIIEKDKENA